MFNCPSCDKSLRTGAKSCACGWSVAGTKPAKAEQSALLEASLDPQCFWKARGERCRFPVKFFEPGARTALCRWHLRHKGDPDIGARIVAWSLTCTQEQYEAKCAEETYGKNARTQMEDMVFKSLFANREL